MKFNRESDGKFDLRKDITIPKINSSLFAEFYGIMLGDGCVYSNLNGICISGNSILDNHYYNFYLSRMIQELFNVKPHIYYTKNTKSIRCAIYSQEIAKFLVELGFPKGKKKLANPIIPLFIMNKNTLLKSCLRGLNDSDGSVYPQDNSKVILDISITVNSLLDSTIKAFENIDFPINHTYNRIYLCNENNVSLFFNKIGSSNMRHIIKYLHLKKHGFVPDTIQTERLLKLGKIPKIKLPYGPMV